MTRRLEREGFLPDPPVKWHGQVFDQNEYVPRLADLSLPCLAKESSGRVATAAQAPLA
ncbi:hypothetical protein [Devosia naphthalenivorans]|uniref:hypothetical protein n=1 Tax=Devosia naphthalenivorans TaxID=2082392 RepID=UPI0013B05164|nr:hypothetical protein [Devosia naphthalenivorans]